MRYSKKLRPDAAFLIFIFLVSFVGLLAFQAREKTRSPISPYLHQWHSDMMMQTKPIIELKTNPFRTVFFNSIQPPTLDLIRAALAFFTKFESEKQLLQDVDMALYKVWAIFYALLNCAVFIFLRRLCKSYLFSFGATILWAFHPAAISYSILLEGTLMSAAAFAWFFYFFYGALERKVPVVVLALSAIFLLYTRTAIQWHFFPILLVSCFIGGMKKASILKLALICVLLSYPLLAKQRLFFHTWSTTTTQGEHLLGILWHRPTQEEVKPYLDQIAQNQRKFPWSIFEKIYPLEGIEKSNLAYGEIFRERIVNNPSESWLALQKTLILNANDFWKPSSSFVTSTANQNLPFRNTYDFLFSEIRFQLALLIASIAWMAKLIATKPSLRKIKAKHAAAMGLAFSYIFLILHLGSRFEWTEAVRMKFLVEPILFTFLATQVWSIACSFRIRILRLPSRKSGA